MTLSRHRLLLTSLALGAAFFASVPSVAEASTNTPTVKELVNNAKTSLSKVSGVHISVTSKNGKVKSSIVVEMGTTSGQEVIKLGTDHVTVSVTPKWAYLKGNAAGLTKIMGLTSAQAKKLGSSTMDMKVGTTQYTSLEQNLTTPVLTGILPALTNKKLHVTKGPSAHQYNLDWSTAASSTSLATTTVLTFSVGNTTLPVTESITNSKGVGKTTFSNWNESVKVNTPAKSSLVTYAHVFG